MVLTLLKTLATSMIWGINTLFLLDAGLSKAQAFLATLSSPFGQVVFEIPTGIVADLYSYATSFLVGAAVQAIAIPFAFLARNQELRSADKG